VNALHRLQTTAEWASVSKHESHWAGIGENGEAKEMELDNESLFPDQTELSWLDPRETYKLDSWAQQGSRSARSSTYLPSWLL